MRDKHADTAALLAWNGLLLSLPEGWRPARLGVRHVLLEDEDGPAFECKWRPGAGRQGMEAALRALTPRGHTRTDLALPATWAAALGDYEYLPLSWSRDGHTGLGAALYCPDTGTAAVFQGYGGPEGVAVRRLEHIAALLAGICFDRPGPPEFRIFGFAFTPPADFLLTDFAFEPGRFSLTFGSGSRRLDVVRLAPADVLLARESSTALAARTFGFAADTVGQPGKVAGCPALWLGHRQGKRGLEAVLRNLGRPGKLAVLCHVAASNKLIGAAMTSSKPVARDWLASVVAAGVSV